MTPVYSYYRGVAEWFGAHYKLEVSFGSAERTLGPNLTNDEIIIIVITINL